MTDRATQMWILHSALMESILPLANVRFPHNDVERALRKRGEVLLVIASCLTKCNRANESVPVKLQQE